MIYLLPKLRFYRKYYSHSREKATKYKIDYLKKLIENDRIYKFISFDNDKQLNQKKLDAFKNDTLWFSHYLYLNDKTEFEIQCNSKEVALRSGIKKEGIDFFIASLKELYDVCSFTYSYEDYMWDVYANFGKGIYIVFQVQDYDILYPIEYIDKSKLGFHKI